MVSEKDRPYTIINGRKFICKCGAGDGYAPATCTCRIEDFLPEQENDKLGGDLTEIAIKRDELERENQKHIESQVYYESKIEKLENQLEEYKQDHEAIGNYRTQFVEYKSKIEKLENKIKRKNHRIKWFKVHNKNLWHQVVTKGEREKQLQKEIQHFKEDYDISEKDLSIIETKNLKIEVLQKENSELHVKTDFLETEKEVFRKENQELTERNKLAKPILEISLEEIKKLEKQNSYLNESNAHLGEDYAVSEANNTDLKKKNQELKIEQDKSNEIIELIKQENDK